MVPDRVTVIPMLAGETPSTGSVAARSSESFTWRTPLSPVKVPPRAVVEPLAVEVVTAVFDAMTAKIR